MRTYDAAFRIEAVKSAGEIGSTKAAKESGIPSGTLDTWLNKAKKGILADGTGNLAEENKRLEQEIRELRRTNEILSKAAAFFAHSRKK